MYRKPKRIKKKKSILKTKWFWIVLLFAAAAIGILYTLFISPVFQIEKVQVQETNPVLQTALRQAIEQSAQKNILLFSAQKIQNQIEQQFPEIESISVQKHFFHTIVATVKNRQEVGVWCKTQDICFAIDAKGIAFLQQKPQNDFIVWDFTQSFTVGLGETAIAQNLLRSLLGFKQKVETLSVFRDTNTTFISVSLISDSQVQYKTSEGWQVFIDPAGNLDWQITKLEMVLSQKIPANKRKMLDYVDLRYGDQAYIKYQGM